MNRMLRATIAGTILVNQGIAAIAKDAVEEVGSKVLSGEWMPDTLNTGRNAAKRAARARIYKGPAKTPKGLKGK